MSQNFWNIFPRIFLWNFFLEFFRGIFPQIPALFFSYLSIPGAICSLEKLMKSPLFWIICFLHFLESPLHHMIEYWDGDRKNPTATSGPLGVAVTELPGNLKVFVKWDRKPFKNAEIPTLDDEMLQKSVIQNT